MIRIENRRTYRGEGIYIGRPSLLGNPTVSESVEDRKRSGFIADGCGIGFWNRARCTPN
jgi:hypothetical protein